MDNINNPLLNSSWIDILLIYKYVASACPTGSDSGVLKTLGRMLPFPKKADRC